MKTVHLMTDHGGNMRKVIKKTSSVKRSPTAKRQSVVTELTASERRILQFAAMGMEDEPDGVLAGANFKFSS
ncbi:hypothetical protein [Pseudomonas sp. PD9R]|uniref:hypothetical protein n=1 Tax=Pseudomonas sp. PD9R TaxID=2853534 RepID=UPI001C457750|nr:hypothetical protein [Pseudomonas sp. PD9R]MBV6822710.1 hypothetical protein [Pseudomonas sp. PD9R]